MIVPKKTTIDNTSETLLKVNEKYEKGGARYPWLRPVEKPVTRDGKVFNHRYYVKRGLGENEIPRKGAQLVRSSHFRDLKDKSLHPDFFSKSPANLHNFPLHQYSDRFSDEAKSREEHFGPSNQLKNRPLRELMSLGHPEHHIVASIISPHSLKKIPLYYNATAKRAVPVKESVSNDEHEFSRDLIEVLMFRHGFRDEHGHSPSLAFMKSALDTNSPELHKYVKKGAKTIIRKLLSDARLQGWHPGKLNEDGICQNPLRLTSAESQDSDFQITRAFAEILQRHGQGYTIVDEGFRQTNSMKLTDKESKFFNQPQFEGEVIPNCHYTILTDIISTGALLLNLGGLIASQGGIVSGYHSISSVSNGHDIVPTEDIREFRKTNAITTLYSELDRIEDHISEAYDNHKDLMGDFLEDRKHITSELKKHQTKSVVTYEVVLGKILNMDGNRELEEVIKHKTGLTLLTMSHSELVTLSQMLYSIEQNSKNLKQQQNAAYILADIISDPLFDSALLEKEHLKKKGESVVKKLFIDYRQTHDLKYIQSLPDKIHNFLRI